MKKNNSFREGKHNISLLTARPKGMSYQEYRKRRAYQNAWLKERLKGFMCRLNWLYMTKKRDCPDYSIIAQMI